MTPQTCNGGFLAPPLSVMFFSIAASAKWSSTRGHRGMRKSEEFGEATVCRQKCLSTHAVMTLDTSHSALGFYVILKSCFIFYVNCFDLRKRVR